MFKNKKDDSMMVKEKQYRAVITYLPNKKAYKASVQVRLGIDEWKRVQCGLKGVLFDTYEQAEMIARGKIRLQKALDNAGNEPVSYIIYDD